MQDEPPRHWGLAAPEALGLEDLTDLDLEFLGDDPVTYDRVDGILLMGSGTWTGRRQTLLEQSLARNPRPVLVGNPDIIAPRETELSIEPGYYAHQLADRTGVTPRFFGKPFGNIFDLAFARLGPGFDRSRTVMVGDSLHTDILGGQAAGLSAALIAGYGFFAGHDPVPAIARSGIRPDYVLNRP